MFPIFSAGLPKPEKDELSLSVDDMRAAVHQAMYDSVLIRNAMLAADHKRLCGEDRYTLLAYSALRALEDLHKQHMRLVMLTPMPPVIIRP